MKIAIVGSRDYENLAAVRAYVRRLPLGTIVISGHARGVDRTAEIEARRVGLEVVSIPADWARYGKQAGFIRNHALVTQADRVVAFWNGYSNGTNHTIKLARRLGKIVDVNPHEAGAQQIILPGFGDNA